jgi:hypothetical protein
MKKLFLILAVLSLMFTGCAKKYLPPPNYPDFSTPEAAFKTSTYAFLSSDYEVYLNSLDISYQQKYGKTKEEQLTQLRKDATNGYFKPKLMHEIIKVEPSGSRNYDVKVYFSVKSGNEVTVQRSWVCLKKIHGVWKEVFPPEAEPKIKS